MAKPKETKKRGPAPEHLVIPPDQTASVLDRLLKRPKPAPVATKPTARGKRKPR